MGKSSKKHQARKIERSESSVDSTTGGDRRPRWRDPRDEQDRRPRLQPRPGPDPRFALKKQGQDQSKDGPGDQHRHRKYNLMSGGSEILSCMDMQESEQFKEKWTRCDAEHSCLDNLFRQVKSSIARCVERELQDVDRWWTSVGINLEDQEIEDFLGGFQPKEEFHQNMGIGQWQKMQRYLLAKKLKAHEIWKSQEGQRNTDAQVKELQREVAAARAVADAAKRDAAASARASVKTAETTAKMIADDAARAKKLVFEEADLRAPKEDEAAVAAPTPAPSSEMARLPATQMAAPPKEKGKKRKKPETSSSSSSEDEDSPLPVELTEKQRKALKKSVADDTAAKQEKRDPPVKDATVILYRGICADPSHNATGSRIQIGSYCRTCLLRWEKVEEMLED